MAEITIEGVTKVFPGGVRAVDDVSLSIPDGEFAVLVGPSGSGKSTVLRMIAGLEEITSGRILIDDKVVNDLRPRARDIAMVFQDYALYPQMTAYETMEFALRIQGKAKAERADRVNATASMLGIRPLLGRKPQQLSGGQRQRVAMGRAIVREPQAFLMDEPLSNLDAKLRGQMRAEIGRLHQRLGTTTVLVTHDQIEAMTMAGRITVMREGRIEQVDAPKRLYDSPCNLFVAGFIGSPPMNFIRARLSMHAGNVSAQFGAHVLDVPREVLERHRKLAHVDGSTVILGFRPESVEDAEIVGSTREGSTIQARVGLVEPMGAETVIHFDVDAPADSVSVMEALVEADPDAEATPAAEESPFSARLSPRSKAREGQSMQLAIDTSRLYLFDPSTQNAL